MIVTMNFKNMDGRDLFKEYAFDKTKRLKKYFNGKIHVTWTLSLEKNDRIAHCHIVGNHIDYFMESKGESFFEALDLGIDRIEKQIKRKKEKVKNRRPHQRQRAA